MSAPRMLYGNSCLLIWHKNEEPEDGFHLCDPEEIRNFLDGEGDFSAANPDLCWIWDEI